MKFTVRKYGRRGKGYHFRENRIIKNMKAVHMLAAIAWGGGALSMQALGFLRRSLDDPQFAANVDYCAHFIDTWVVIPGLFGCILTGLFYSLCTAIGFFKFAWIGYKWLITASACFWGLLFWGPWGNELIAWLAPMGLDFPLSFMRSLILPQNLPAALLQTFIILSMCLISVFRPISFRLWRWGSEKKELARRVSAVRSQDRNLAMPTPLDNRQVQMLYNNWLGEPLGLASKTHLHMKLRDKSGALDKLKRADLYPPAHMVGKQQ